MSIRHLFFLAKTDEVNISKGKGGDAN